MLHAKLMLPSLNIPDRQKWRSVVVLGGDRIASGAEIKSATRAATPFSMRGYSRVRAHNIVVGAQVPTSAPGPRPAQGRVSCDVAGAARPYIKCCIGCLQLL
jgi:hypothetical protein